MTATCVPLFWGREALSQFLANGDNVPCDQFKCLLDPLSGLRGRLDELAAEAARAPLALFRGDLAFVDHELYLNCCGASLECRGRANVESRRRLMQELA
jgi:hypothetical protein